MSHTSTSIRSMGYFVNGGWSTHGSESVVKSPYDNSVLAVLSEAGRDDVELAIQSAVQSFPLTRKLTSQHRAAILREIAEAISDRRDEFARTICQEAAKP